MNTNILIIEDETAIQSILSELLTDAGYNIEVASDGLEGITKFRKKPFSLVLLDIMMPKIDGYTVCEMIRQESNVPIIMLTALDEEEAQVKAFELQVDDYITKPFSVRLVLMRVEAVLRRAKDRNNQEITTNLVYENIRLNRESHSVFVGGNPISLTTYGIWEFWSYSCSTQTGYLHGTIYSMKCGDMILLGKKRQSISIL